MYTLALSKPGPPLRQASLRTGVALPDSSRPLYRRCDKLLIATRRMDKGRRRKLLKGFTRRRQRGADARAVSILSPGKGNRISLPPTDKPPESKKTKADQPEASTETVLKLSPLSLSFANHILGRSQITDLSYYRLYSAVPGAIPICVSFPPHVDMLEFGGYSYLIQGQP